MQTQTLAHDALRYARAIEVSKRVRFDIDRDVIRGRSLGFGMKFMPDSLSLLPELGFLDAAGRRFLSQIQGRTYANIFGMAERFIGAKMLEQSKDHWLGNQTALEALVRFTDEELKHQEMFRRVEALASAEMPPGYRFVPDANTVAATVLGACTWAVLGLTCFIEIFVLEHYHHSIDKDPELSQLWKDVFLHHAREEAQHAVLDEMEWQREDAKLGPAQREQAVDEMIALVGAVDAVLQAQSRADADYFESTLAKPLAEEQSLQLRATLLKAYRWQHIVLGTRVPRFQKLVGSLLSPAQLQRVEAAFVPLAAGLSH